MGYARQSVQRVADNLEREGLIAYKSHPKDRRTKLLYLTPQGQRVMAAIYERQLEWSTHIVAALGDEFLAQAADVLEQAGEKLAREINKDVKKDTI